MESLVGETSRTLTPAYFTSRQVFLPTEIIFHLSNFLEFEDFRNFIRAMWPNGDEDETFQERLWQLSTHKIVATFFNGKEIEVEYNYDRERLLKDRIEINLQSVLPILGEVELPDGNEFVNPLTMEEFLYKNVKLRKCEQGMHSFCRDVGEDSDEEDSYVCPHHHFHRYCAKHINRWFREYLSLLIALQHGLPDFAELIQFTSGEFGNEIAGSLSDYLTPFKLLLWFIEMRKCNSCLDSG